METIPLFSLLLKGHIEVPLEVFIILIVVTGGIYLVIYIINSARYASAKREYIKKTEDSIYALAIAMIRADGKIEPEELSVAEAIGKKLYDKFDSRKFRELVKQVNLTQDPKRLARDAGEILSSDGKRGVLLYLQHIAVSDGDVGPKERKLLSSIAKEWGLPIPELPEDRSIGIEGIMYALAASVITADRVVEDDELAVAGAIGQQLFENFNIDELRSICSNKDQIPEGTKLAGMINDHLTDEGKEIIVKFLAAIASSSSQDNKEGLAVVGDIKEVWGVG